MIKRIIFIVLIAFTVSVNAQNNRILSMGGMSVSVPDSDYSLNLHDFGENPSWLIKDEHQAFLRITPAFSRISGDYKRKYDFGSSDLYGIQFKSIKPLGENGTFLGYTSYSYERRNDVYRNLKYNLYSGEAFLPQDTTTGDFRYNGPTVGFSYSCKVTKDILFGATAGYQILESLKYTYSNVKGMIRNVNGRLGISCILSEEVIAGFTYDIYDTQESLEMSSIDGTNVEIMNFRGDTYATTIRSSTITQKIKRKGGTFGVQAFYCPSELIELAAKGGYDLSGATILLPKGNIKEYEEGYSSFENYDLRLRANYHPAENLQLGASLKYINGNSWSKNSPRDLLLWTWNLESVSSVLGCSYFLKEYNLLLAIEYELANNKADSSKYIDIRFNKTNSLDNYFRVGAEYNILHSLILRAGYNAGFIQRDMLYGGSDIKIKYFSLGCGYKAAGMYELDVCLLVGNMAPGNLSSLKRDNLNLSASVKIFSF